MRGEFVMENAKKMSRKDFLKVGILGALGAALLTKNTVLKPEAAVKDSLGSGSSGVKVSDTAPSNKGYLWIDTSAGGRGIAKYWNGSAWSATASAWAD